VESIFVFCPLTRRKHRTFNMLSLSLTIPAFMFDITSIIILVAVGIAGGTVGSILGVGGGIIFTPTLTLLGLHPTSVSSTSLIAVAFTSISSTVSYARRRRIKYETASRLAILSAPGAVLGAYFSAIIPTELFKLMFSVILISAVIYMLFNSHLKERKAEIRESQYYRPVAYFCAFAAGVVSSLFGVGGGIIFVPLLLIILGMRMYEAAPTSQFVIMISAVIGLAIHVMLGHPDYLHALSLAIGAFAGGLLGAELSGRLRERLLQIFLSVYLLLVACRLIFEVTEDAL
jgi:uncharacterized protein